MNRSGAKGTDTGAASAAAEGPLLQESVQTLSHMIGDLEKQLENVLAINRALEKDLDASREATAQIEHERDSFRDQVERLRRDVSGIEEIRAELSHVASERARLAATIAELGRQLAEAEQEGRKAIHLADKTRVERDDALEELQSVEAQFERAIEMVEDLRARVTTLAEERDAVVDRVKVVDAELRATVEERDLYKSEVAESKAALDEIRRHVSDACELPQRYLQGDKG